MSQAIIPFVKLSSPQPDGLQRAQFGYRIPFLPDMLADHTLLGQTDSDRIAEVLSRWTQFILGLRKWQGSAFSLRFLAWPESGSIDVAIVGRVEASHERIAHIEAALRTDLESQLVTFGFPYKPLDRDGLHQVCYPMPAPEIVEVRQHEELTPLLSVQSDAYVVHHFWSPAGSWLLPFEAMLRQPVPVAVNLFLQPTQLTTAEHDALAEAAHIAQTVADLQKQVQSGYSVSRLRDPQAELVGRIYATILSQLTEPFLVLIQVASADRSAAWSVGRVMGAAITAGKDIRGGDSGERDLPTAFDVRPPRNQAELAAARRCLSQLAFCPWGNELAGKGKERLAYLVGARGAAAAFRFPISVRGGVPGISVRQQAPDFEPGPRPAVAAADEIHLGSFRRGGAVTVKLKHLARHALVTGFTGAGKTNTVLYLLKQLWTQHRIPFLVIEAAKKEYRGFIDQPGFEDVLVFSLGDETTSPFRLNPFELLDGVRLEAHLGGLQTCFDAALPQFGILPSIVAESLEEVYKDKRWRMTDRGNASHNRVFPTLRDLFSKVIRVTESRGYVGETYYNIRAAAAGRIGSLLRGSKGRMFSCQRSVPLDIIMNRPVVLELNDLSQQDKALTMMFLLMLLREYREIHKAKNLQHVTVIEEAHNVMENVQSVGASEVAADTRAKAVEAFSAMLAEVRAYGEGIIISDQSPEKLAPDAVRNTNVQIAHQLRHRTDREAIAAAMIMDEAQEEYLGKLQVGAAAVFMTGYDRATFMQVPNYKDEVNFSEPTDEIVQRFMASFKEQHVGAYLPFDGCRFCQQRCKFLEVIEPQTRDQELVEKFQTAVRRFNSHPERQYWHENWIGVTKVCVEAGELAGHAGELDAAWCYMAHEIDFPFTPHMRQAFETAGQEL